MARVKTGDCPALGDPPWYADASRHTPPVGVDVCTSCTRVHTNTVGTCTANHLVSCRAGRCRPSYERPAQVAGVQTAQDDHRWHGVHCWGEARSPKEHADSPVMGECRPGNSDTGSSASPDRQKPRYRELRPQHPNLGSPGWRPGDDTPCRMMPMLSSRTYDLL